MDDKAKQARNEYMREYRKNNPDKIRQANATYWKRQAEKQEQEQSQKSPEAI